MRRTKMLHILEMLIVCGVGLTLILYPEKSWAYATKILAIALLAGGVIALLYYLIIRKRGKADKSMVLIAIFVMLVEFTYFSTMLMMGPAVILCIVLGYALLCLVFWKKVKAMALEGQNTLQLVLEREEATNEE